MTTIEQHLDGTRLISSRKAFQQPFKEVVALRMDPVLRETLTAPGIGGLVFV